MRHQRVGIRLPIDGLNAARDFFSGCFAEHDYALKILWVAHLDDEGRCIHLSYRSGNSGAVDFPPRKIIADVTVHGSAAILLAHNHPSGDPLPPANATCGDLRPPPKRSTACCSIISSSPTPNAGAGYL